MSIFKQDRIFLIEKVFSSPSPNRRRECPDCNSTACFDCNSIFTIRALTVSCSHFFAQYKLASLSPIRHLSIFVVRKLKIIYLNCLTRKSNPGPHVVNAHTTRSRRKLTVYLKKGQEPPLIFSYIA